MQKRTQLYFIGIALLILGLACDASEISGLNIATLLPETPTRGRAATVTAVSLTATAGPVLPTPTPAQPPTGTATPTALPITPATSPPTLTLSPVSPTDTTMAAPFLTGPTDTATTTPSVIKPTDTATATLSITKPTGTATTTPSLTGPTEMPPPTSSPTQPLPTSPATPSPTAVKLLLKVAAGPLRVRAGPGTDYDTIDGCREGEQLQVIACSDTGEWLKIVHRGLEGWVSASFVTTSTQISLLPIATALPVGAITATSTVTTTPTLTTTLLASPTPLTSTLALTSTEAPTSTVVLTSTVAFTSTVAPTQTADAKFVIDVTVPDDTVFSAGRTFEKVWRMKNTGASSWTEKYGLAFVSGDRLGGTSPQLIGRLVAIGETVDITVTMQAPDREGQYSSYWRMQDEAGNPFGSRMYVRITVQAALPSPGPTSTTSG